MPGKTKTKDTQLEPTQGPAAAPAEQPAQEPQPAEVATATSTPAAAAAPTASKHLEGHYLVKGIRPGRVHTLSHGTVDLRTIDLATAHELAKDPGFPYLVAVEKAETE